MRKIPQTAHVVATLTSRPTPDQRVKLVEVPGVRVYGAEVLIPHHALALAMQQAASLQLYFSGAVWSGGSAPPGADPREWVSVEADLRAGGETRAFAPDGFPA